MGLTRPSVPALWAATIITTKVPVAKNSESANFITEEGCRSPIFSHSQANAAAKQMMKPAFRD